MFGVVGIYILLMFIVIPGVFLWTEFKWIAVIESFMKGCICQGLGTI